MLKISDIDAYVSWVPPSNVEAALLQPDFGTVRQVIQTMNTLNPAQRALALQACPPNTKTAAQDVRDNSHLLYYGGTIGSGLLATAVAGVLFRAPGASIAAMGSVFFGPKVGNWLVEKRVQEKKAMGALPIVPSMACLDAIQEGLDHVATPLAPTSIPTARTPNKLHGI